MPLTSSNPLKEEVFFVNEMDPVFEDKLARILNGWPEVEEDKTGKDNHAKKHAYPRIPAAQTIIVIKEPLPEKV